MKRSKILYTLALAAAFLASGRIAMAADWSVSFSGGKFVITRTNTSNEASIQYRTASMTALEGKHFNALNGSLTFAAGESTKEVSASEIALSSVPLRYKYQCNNYLYYYFEVADQGGNRITRYKKSIFTGGTTNNQYYLNNLTSYVNYGDYFRDLTYFNTQKVSTVSGTHYHDEPYTPPTSDVETEGTLAGYVAIDDSYDYQYKSATVTPSWLFVTNRAGATGEWHKLVGNKLLASVVFTEKEWYDGYGYVQILIGDGNSAYDHGYDPNEKVDDPVNSIYKACFELKKGSGAYSGTGKWIFPHTYDHHNESEQISDVGQYDDHTAFWMTESYLWQQKFRSEGYRAGRFNNAFVLDPDISGLTVRFDTGGSGDDTYGYKDLFVRWALVDDTAPTVIKDDITVSPGLHAKGNYVSISIPFSEPVHLDHSSDRYILHTSWGGLVADEYCDNCNVVTFTGVITANAGTALTIDNIEITYNPNYGSTAPIRPIKDMFGHEFGGDVSKSFSMIVDAVYSITYNLAGGSVQGENPAKYAMSSGPITLINPTREHYVFAGWTGTGLDGPTMTVTIPSGSSGDRSYTATWAPDVASYWTGDGSQANPYVISTPEGLEFLAVMVEDNNIFQYKYFELGADIDMSGISTFNGIGRRAKVFRGIVDGKGHSISNFTITENGETESALFRYKESGAVKNIAVTNATISGSRYVAAIVGYSSLVSVSGCSAIDCTLSSSHNSGSAYAGSIVGYMTNADATGCIADGCSVSGSGSSTFYAGGIVGYCGTSYSYRSISNNVIANCTLDGSAANESHVGTVVGWLNGDGSTTGAMGCSANFVLNTNTSGTNSLYGLLYQKAYTNESHYYRLTCGTDAPVSDVYTVTANDGIIVNGTAAASYAGTDYYSPETVITVSAASGFTLGSVSYTPEGGSETLATDNGNGSWSFTVTDSDITINSLPRKLVTLVQGAKDNVSAWWGSFFDSTSNYKLEGGSAYTLGTDYKLYRLGTDGKTIPAGVAVVIIATSANVSLIPAGKGPVSVTDNATGGNRLRGSDSAVPVSGLSGIPYVLSLKSGAIGFRMFNGDSIPAGKAYYVK